MAFIGIVIMFIVLIIFGVIAFATFAMLVIGTVLLFTKHKKAAAVLYIIASIPIVITITLISVYSYSKKFPKFKTYSGETVTIDMRDVEKMEHFIINNDMEGLNALIDKKPDLIYYLDVNQISLLEYGLFNCDTRIMQIAAEHGARFDDENAYKHLVFTHSLQHFFSELDYWVFAYDFETKPEPKFKTGAATEEMIEAVKFAIDHGAGVKWESYDGEEHTFAESVEEWIAADDEISDKDEELLELANSALR